MSMPDYRRFLHTVGLVPNGTGKLLEIGANPYYTTLLLKLFTGYELSLTNYFVDSDPAVPSLAPMMSTAARTRPVSPTCR